MTDKVKSQTKFTKIEAVAICEMMATLAAEGFKLAIYHNKATDNPEGNGQHYPFIVQVIGGNNEVIASGCNYFLIDALQDAYSATPEKVATQGQLL